MGDELKAVYGDESLPKDPWDHDFIYVVPGPNGLPYDVISYGSDGLPGANPTGCLGSVDAEAADIRLSDFQTTNR